MTRPCSVCKSILLDEIHNMKEKGYSIKEIYKFCMNENLPITLNSLYYHFKNHYTKIKEKDREDLTLKLISQLENSLEICNSKIEEILRSGKVEDVLLLKWISETRQLVSQLMEVVKNLRPSNETMTKDELFKKLLYCLSHISVEDLKEFERKWKEYKLQ